MWTKINERKYQIEIAGMTVILTCQYDWWGIRWTVTDKDGKQSDGETLFAHKEYKSPEDARRKAAFKAIEAHQAQR